MELVPSAWEGRLCAVATRAPRLLGRVVEAKWDTATDASMAVLYASGTLRYWDVATGSHFDVQLHIPTEGLPADQHSREQIPCRPSALPMRSFDFLAVNGARRIVFTIKHHAKVYSAMVPQPEQQQPGLRVQSNNIYLRGSRLYELSTQFPAMPVGVRSWRFADGVARTAAVVVASADGRMSTWLCSDVLTPSSYTAATRQAVQASPTFVRGRPILGEMTPGLGAAASSGDPGLRFLAGSAGNTSVLAHPSGIIVMEPLWVTPMAAQHGASELRHLFATGGSDGSVKLWGLCYTERSTPPVRPWMIDPPGVSLVCFHEFAAFPPPPPGVRGCHLTSMGSAGWSMWRHSAATRGSGAADSTRGLPSAAHLRSLIVTGTSHGELTAWELVVCAEHGARLLPSHAVSPLVGSNAPPMPAASQSFFVARSSGRACEPITALSVSQPRHGAPVYVAAAATDGSLSIYSMSGTQSSEAGIGGSAPERLSAAGVRFVFQASVGSESALPSALDVIRELGGPEREMLRALTSSNAQDTVGRTLGWKAASAPSAGGSENSGCLSFPDISRALTEVALQNAHRAIVALAFHDGARAGPSAGSQESSHSRAGQVAGALCAVTGGGDVLMWASGSLPGSSPAPPASSFAGSAAAPPVSFAQQQPAQASVEPLDASSAGTGTTSASGPDAATTTAASDISFSAPTAAPPPPPTSAAPQSPPISVPGVSTAEHTPPTLQHPSGDQLEAAAVVVAAPAAIPAAPVAPPTGVAGESSGGSDRMHTSPLSRMDSMVEQRRAAASVPPAGALGSSPRPSEHHTAQSPLTSPAVSIASAPPVAPRRFGAFPVAVLGQPAGRRRSVESASSWSLVRGAGTGRVTRATAPAPASAVAQLQPPVVRSDAIPATHPASPPHPDLAITVLEEQDMSGVEWAGGSAAAVEAQQPALDPLAAPPIPLSSVSAMAQDSGSGSGDMLASAGAAAASLRGRGAATETGVSATPALVPQPTAMPAEPERASFLEQVTGIDDSCSPDAPADAQIGALGAPASSLPAAAHTAGAPTGKRRPVLGAPGRGPAFTWLSDSGDEAHPSALPAVQGTSMIRDLAAAPSTLETAAATASRRVAALAARAQRAAAARLTQRGGYSAVVGAALSGPNPAAATAAQAELLASLSAEMLYHSNPLQEMAAALNPTLGDHGGGADAALSLVQVQHELARLRALQATSEGALQDALLHRNQPARSQALPSAQQKRASSKPPSVTSVRGFSGADDALAEYLARMERGRTRASARSPDARTALHQFIRAPAPSERGPSTAVVVHTRRQPRSSPRAGVCMACSRRAAPGALTPAGSLAEGATACGACSSASVVTFAEASRWGTTLRSGL